MYSKRKESLGGCVWWQSQRIANGFAHRGRRQELLNRKHRTSCRHSNFASPGLRHTIRLRPIAWMLRACPSSKRECALRLSNIHTRQEVIERIVLLIAPYKKYTMPLLKRPHKVTMYELAVSLRTGTLTKFAVTPQEKQKAEMTKPTILGK